MPHYLINVTDNTFAVTIVFSLLLTLAGLISRRGQRAFIFYGVMLGATAALIYAVLKRHTGFAVREYYDLGVIASSILLQAVMFMVMWRLFAAHKGNSPGGRALLTLLLGALSAYFLPSLMLYPFEFAVGMESVFNMDFLYSVLGYSFGLLLMFLLGFSICAVSARLPRAFLFAFLLTALLVFLAKQGLEATQILVARNMLPRRPWLMSLVIFILNNVNWFAFALMGITAFFTGALALRLRLEPARDGNPAIRRKQKAEHRVLYRHCACIVLCLLISALNITVVRSYANREVEISPPLETFATDGKILLPIEKINDGNLHRFQYKTSGGTAVRYIVIKKSGTAYGVGLDACDICGASGYYQRKDQVICKLCDVVMNKSTIGFPGGCNPVPLRFGIAQGHMVIMAADLEAEKQRFQ